MRDASYRGVPFSVTSDDKESGRRTVVHEFPQREDVYVEDLGESPSRFVLQAFVLGADYMEKRDALERALLESGSGTLIHPWYGEITVSQFAPYKVKHSAENGGIAIFTLSFVRDAEPSSPSPTVNQKARSLNISHYTGLLSCDVFDAVFSLVSQSNWVVENAYSSVSQALSSVESLFNGNISTTDVLANTSTSESLGQTLWSVCQGVAETALQKGKTQAQVASDWLSVASSHIPTSVPKNLGSTRSQIATNDLAVHAFIRHIAVVEASSNIALAVPESLTQARNLRNVFMEVLDTILIDESDIINISDTTPVRMPDALYIAFTDVRACTLASLAIAAKTAPNIIQTKPPTILPSLVLCYQLTGNIALQEDIVARNHIIHPCFVPVEDLEVLVYE